MNELALLIGALAILLALGATESLAHAHNLKRIPLRIHVNGTRGKSSVTRLIAGGLRAGGIPTCAKTTGSKAAMILPDGSEYPIYRAAGPNIIEQVRIVDTAVSVGAQALVVECMALQPILQSLSEFRLIRATHGVITNVRPDHLDVMGPDERNVADAFAGMVPVGGTLFAATDDQRGIFEGAVRDRQSDLVVITPAEIAEVNDADMRGFSYLEHRENVAVALRVCSEAGVERDVALQGMWSATPDPGSLTVHEVEFFGRHLFFANGLAANDPDSTERIWRALLQQFPDVARRIALFNCRIDRPDRSRQLGEACVDWPTADQYVVMGTGTYIFARAATKKGLDVRKLILAEHQEPSAVFEILLEHSGESALIMGMGNVHGGGEELARLFRNRGKRMDLHEWS